MGTGIGINCERCGYQLTYDDGFETVTLNEEDIKLCSECASIVKFDNKYKK